MAFSAANTSDLEELVGQTIGEPVDGERRRYRLTRFLGRGGFGAVFEAFDTKFEETDEAKVAVKVARGMVSEEAFRREAKLARRFKHPHVVQVFDYGADRGIFYLVMEYLSGLPLADLIGRHPDGLPPELLDKLVREIGSALTHAHERNLVHRDLKPKNILLVDGGGGDGQEGRPHRRFVLLDFGTSSQIDATNSLVNRTMAGAGTPEYMSPEQVTARRDATAGPATDVYSFGVILYEILTGSVPFPLTENSQLGVADCLRDIVQTPPPEPDCRRIDPARGDIEELKRLLRQCLAKKPEERPAQMREVRDRFLRAFRREPAKTGPATLQPSPSGPEPSGTEAEDLPETQPLSRPRWRSRSGRRARRLTLVGAVLVVAAALGMAWLLRPPAVWLPQGRRFQRDPNASIRTIDERNYADRIVRVLEDGTQVAFLLIPAEPDRSGTFYIMQNKVWNGLFRKFAVDAATGNGPLPPDDRRPKMNVTVTQAYRFSQWLCGEPGHLPTTEQWDKAAGYHLWKQSRLEPPFDRGPFRSTGEIDHVAVDRNTPREVGTAMDDIGPYGCRDMAGNGLELTRMVWKPGHLPLVEAPIADPGDLDSVIRRGRSYKAPTPLLYEELQQQRNDQPDTQPYLERSPQTGFRAVLELR